MFFDRIEAAEKLADRLVRFKRENPVILGLPRGGVPIARVVADKLGARLNIIISKKIGYPGNEEYAIGAVTEFGDEEYGEVGLANEAMEKAKAKTLEKIERYEAGLRPSDCGFPSVRDRTVILVDDGIATGQTMFAAIKSLRRLGASKVIVAVPVAAYSSADRMRELADEAVILEIPPVFFAVGEFYEVFDQVSEEEVRELLTSR